MLAAAEALEVSREGVVDAGHLPRDLRLVAEQDDASVPSLGSVPVPMTAQGHVVSYTSPDAAPGGQRFLAVGTHRGGTAAILVLRWFYGQEMRPRSIAGRDVVLATLKPSQGNVSVQSCTEGRGATTCAPVETESVDDPLELTYILAWAERDGSVVSVTAKGITEEVLVEAAGSVRVMSDREW